MEPAFHYAQESLQIDTKNNARIASANSEERAAGQRSGDQAILYRLRFVETPCVERGLRAAAEPGVLDTRKPQALRL